MKPERVDLIIAAAHELKAPLVLIRHLAQVLKNSDISLGEQLELIERITITAERSLSLTNQLTSASKLTAIQQLDLYGALEPVNLNFVCEQVLHEMHAYAQKFDQKLRLKTVRRSNLAIANKDILHDVVVNLVDSSIKHNPVGGVVELSSTASSKMIRLKIKDDAPGIESSEFKMLEKNINTQKHPLSGMPGTSGVGLYVAGRLTAAMGGELRLGRAARGTVFLIDLLNSSQLKFL